MKILNKVIQYVKNNPKQVFFILSLSCTLIIAIILDFIWAITQEVDKWYSNIAVEFHGLIFDIILFGIVFTVFEKYYEKKQSLTRYLEELDDYRGWTEKEASYRIHGIIRRLNKLRFYDINLSNCQFVNQRLSFKIKGKKNKTSKNSSVDYLTRWFDLKITECNAENTEFSTLSIDNSTLIFKYCQEIFFEDCLFNNCKINIDARTLRLGPVQRKPVFQKCLFIDCEINIDTIHGGFEDCDFYLGTTLSDRIREEDLVNCKFHDLRDIIEREIN